MTTVFLVVIAAAVVVVVVVVVVVLAAYWPHRPGPKYKNPGKKIAVSSKFGVKIYHRRISMRSVELLTKSENIMLNMSQN